MTKWRSVVVIGDLHKSHENGEITINEVARRLEECLAANRFKEALHGFRKRLLMVEDVEEYDDILEELYDFADDGHKIWLDA